MPQPSNESGAQPAAKIYDAEAHTNPEDTLLEDAPKGAGERPQRASTGGKGGAMSWLLVLAVLAVVVLLAYGGFGR